MAFVEDYDDTLLRLQDEIITLKKENHKLKMENDKMRKVFRVWQQ